VRRADIAELVTLAMLWGGAFLFMRVGAPQFGPFALIALRVGIASVLLLALAAARGRLGEMRRHAPALALLGVVNSAVPFVLFAYAALHVTAGFSAILNSTSPMFTAIVAYAWFGERLGAARVLGLVVGLAGVVVLAWERVSWTSGAAASAVGACLVASAFYGVGGNLARRRLAGVDPYTVAAGSQCAASAVLLPFAIAAWPAASPSPLAWGAVAVLGLASTGVAFILYFRLIANVGPSKAITVTFLVPAFGMLFGALFLGERVTASMAAGAVIVVAGTAMATGVLRVPRCARRASDAVPPVSPRR